MDLLHDSGETGLGNRAWNHLRRPCFLFGVCVCFPPRGSIKPMCVKAL